MPSLTNYDYNNLDQLHKIAQEEYAVRRAEIEKRNAYYEGNQKRWLINPKTKKELDENVVINVTQKIIDQSVSMLFGETPEIEAHDDSVNLLIEQMEDNNLDDVFYNSLCASGSIAGHVYVKLIKTPDSVRWVMMNPALVSVYWKPDDGKIATAYKISWTEGQTDYRQDIARIDENNWIVRDMIRRGSGNWEVTKEDVWAYPFAPIIDWQNLPNYLGYYGKTDLTSIDLNDAINFTASNINLILKHHAHPKTIGTGVRADQIKETAVQGFWGIESEAAKVYNLEMQTDLSSSMNYLAFLRGEFFSQQRAVDISSMKDKVGQLTNFGLRVLFSDAIQKNTTKQLLYGYGIKELIYRSLVLMGVTIDANIIDVDFQDPMPINDKENAERIKLELESGVISKQTASEQLGYDWEEQLAEMEKEKLTAGASLGAALLEAMRKQDSENPADVGSMNTGEDA
jgi:hypothetical protein